MQQVVDPGFNGIEALAAVAVVMIAQAVDVHGVLGAAASRVPQA